ncbi:MAG: molybdopterin-dependent oxidoreductase [Eggerthellaceae bacterium]
MDGASCTTVFSLLKQKQVEYTPEWAESVSGVPAATIRQLAREYAEGPACLALGWGGNDKMGNADIAGHAAATLVALTGNVGKVGAGVGVFVGGSYNGHAGTLGAWELPEDMTAGTLEMPLYDAREGNAKVRACIFCGDVLQQHIGNMNKTTEFARGLDFIVTIDPYFTEGAKWADVILPATTRFENDAEVGSVKIGYSNIVLQNKIIEPLFEARTTLDRQEIAAFRQRPVPARHVRGMGGEGAVLLRGPVRLRAHHRQDQRCERRVSPRGHRGAAPRVHGPRVRHPLHAHGRLLRRSCGIRSGASRLRAAA